VDMYTVIGAACKLEFVYDSYHEHTEASRLLQILCTYPYNINHRLRKLLQCYYILEMIVRLNSCSLQLCTPWWWACATRNM